MSIGWFRPRHLRVQIRRGDRLRRDRPPLEQRGCIPQGAPGAGNLPDESICACNCARIAGLDRSATIFGETRRWVTKRVCLNSQIMSPAVGIPADAEAPAPTAATSGCWTESEKRRAKSSAPISGNAVRSSIRRPTGPFSAHILSCVASPAGMLTRLLNMITEIKTSQHKYVSNQFLPSQCAGCVPAVLGKP